MRWWAALVGVAAALQVVGAGRILFLSPVSSKSHKNFYMGVISALADRGHEITLVTPYKSTKPRENIREVVALEMDLTNYMPNLFTEGRVAAPIRLTMQSPEMCNDPLAKPEVQNLLKEEFDFVIMGMFFTECFFSIVHQMKIPYGFIIPITPVGTLATVAGGVSFPSFAYNNLFAVKHPYTFLQRLLLAVYNVVSDLLYDYYVTYQIEKECRRRGLCPDDMPSFVEMRQNSSLILINGIKTLEIPPEPSVPTSIYCGGIHLRPAKPLPKDLEEWVAGAGEDGFIYFSLGSAVIPSHMPEKYRKVLVETFGSLKQRVLWKWDKDTMDDLPPNVRLGKWLPQQDILGHPNLRLFITHGGLLSTQESMYNGIPVLGMPVFADQQSNMFLAEKDGWGKVLHWEDLTNETLKEKIDEVMNDVSLRQESQRRSALMRDQPQRPEDIAVYWVEYVMRHHGAPHLVSPVRSMPWYKLYNVDVWATVIGVVLFIDYLLYKAVCWCCCSGRKKQKRD